MQDQTELPLPDRPVTTTTTTPRPVVECEDCHRALTDHTSRTYGRGPACRRKHGLHPGRRTDGHHVDQEPIPGT